MKSRISSITNDTKDAAGESPITHLHVVDAQASLTRTFPRKYARRYKKYSFLNERAGQFISLLRDTRNRRGQSGGGDM